MTAVSPPTPRAPGSGRKPKLTAYQRDEALKRLEPAESCRSIGKTMGVHHATSAGLGA
jgi:transposase